jgi:hypothetical protein
MFKRLGLFVVSLLWYGFLLGQSFGPNTEVSLITMGPGSDLYSKFGHSAIRLNDPDQNLDIAYNYGTFDFNTPNFYPKFVRGKLDYILSVDPTKPLLRYYLRTGREVIEQQLLLSPSEVQHLADFLAENYKPENRTYQYDFFYDNCATRIRDVLEDIRPSLQFEEHESSNKVYRDLLIEKLQGDPLILLGINLILGPVTDRAIDVRGEMFLPTYLMNNLELTKSGEPVLVGPKNILAPDNFKIHAAPMWKQPALYVWLILLILLIGGNSQGIFRVSKMVSMVLITLVSLCFGLFSFMWLFTEHSTTHGNLNLLWANPIFIYLLWKALKQQIPNPRLVQIGKVLLVLSLSVLVILPEIQMLSDRMWLEGLQIPKHQPFQMFLLGILGLISAQTLKAIRQK